jgi:VanZ family protein
MTNDPPQEPEPEPQTLTQQITSRSVRRLHWLPVLALSLGAPLAAPWLGELRRALEDHLGGGYVQTLAWALGAVGLVAFVGAAAAIRRDRMLRYGLLALALGLVVAQVLLWERGGRRVQLVERVHLVEYGLLAFLYVEVLRERFRDVLLPLAALLATVLVGLADEWVQWATPVRVGDVRDALLNGWGGVIGVLFGVALVPPPRFARRPSARTIRAVRLLGLAVLLAAGGLIEGANRGVTIHDPAAGTFVSAYEPAELLRVRDARARRWAREPPGELRPVAFEDRFLSEAGAHAGARNLAVQKGWYLQAVLENRILERWYTPYLDFYRGDGGGPARWSAQMERQIEEQAGPMVARRARTYRSGVLRWRLTPLPRSVLWGVVLLVAGTWWVAGGRLIRLLEQHGMDRSLRGGAG